MSTIPHIRVWSFMGALVVGLLFATGCDEHAAEKAEIRRLWEDIDAAGDRGDGEGAARQVSGATLSYYGRLVRLGLDGKRDEVLALPPSEKLEVVMMRHRATRAELEKLNGRGYVVFATSRGWYAFAEDEPDWLTLGAITVTGEEATAAMRVEGKATRFRARFVRENGEWKLDEPSLTEMANDLLLQAARQEGMGIDEFIIACEELDSGAPVPETIWEPIK